VEIIEEFETALSIVFARLACPDDDPKELARKVVVAIEKPGSIEFGFTYETDGNSVSFECRIS
jgi:hypothetical protein